MYKSSEEIFEKLKAGKLKNDSVTRNMHKYLYKRDIDKWLLFAKAKALYKMWQLDNVNESRLE